LSQSTLPKFFELNPDLRKFYKESKGTIEVPGRKGIIYIRSTENPNVIEGMTLRWIWGDEAGQMKLQAWINIQGRVSILKGRVFFSTTPYTLNWLRRDFYENWKKGNTDYEVVQFRSVDNPYFPQEEFDRVQSTMDRRTFERRYCGLFTKMEGLVYEDFNFNTHTITVLPEKFDIVISGVDWGFAAPAANIIIGIKDNVFYIIDEFYKEGKTTDELALVAKGFLDKYLVNKFYCDSAEPDRIAAFKKAGLPAVGSDKDITYGISKVQEIIRSNRFFIYVPNCPNTLEEIEAYHFPEVKDDKEASEKPIKMDDHAMDAIRYAIASFLDQNKIIFHKLEENPNFIINRFSLPPVITSEVKELTSEEKEQQTRELDRKIIEEEERKRFYGDQ